jgi:hypothetical protein
MKSFKQFVSEDVAVNSSPGPTNVVSGGAIAGTGEKGGEPGVYMKKKKKVVIAPMARRIKPNM